MAKKKDLYHLSREFLSSAELKAFQADLAGADERTCALVGGAAVEQALVWVLIANFPRHARTQEALTTSSTKTARL